MPDQPWTAWWEVDDVEMTAPRIAPHANDVRINPSEDAAMPASAETPADVLVAVNPEDATEAPYGTVETEVSSEDDADEAPVFPHVDTVMSGGIQRVNVESHRGDPTPGDSPVSVARPNFGGPLRQLTNQAIAEVAATGTAHRMGVQTVYGRFTVEGFAQRAGDLVFTGVTFPDPMSAVPAPGAIEVAVDEASNVAVDGVVVAGLGGFTADRQGFTLITTAVGPGIVRANGHYVVEI